MAGKIFINYRRDDSIAAAGRLHDRLALAFGRKNLFMDVDHIPAGVNFVRYLSAQVEGCHVFLAIIGPNWLDAKDDTGRRRIDSPDDFVSVEIAAALGRQVRVIPVLIDGARMPKAEQLPESLRPLVRRNAVEVRNTQFGRDADMLVQKIREAVNGGAGGARTRRVVTVGIAAVLAMALFAFYMIELPQWVHRTPDAVQSSTDATDKAKATAEAKRMVDAQQAWVEVRNTTDVQKVQDFIDHYSDTQFVDAARARLEVLRRSLPLGPAYDGWTLHEKTLRYYGSPSETACRADCERDAQCLAYTWVKPGGYRPDEPSVCYLKAAVGAGTQHKCCISATRGPFPKGAASDPANAVSPGSGRIFRDRLSGGQACPMCPEMTVVPSGSFMMGSPPNEVGHGESEEPMHQVTIRAPFAVGRFATTFDEWDACVADGGCNGYKPSDQGWGRGKRPAIRVSWDDANLYVAWLRSKTGKPYRLLSDAEREYVTRAGTRTPFWWGSTISTKQANYNGNFSSAYSYGAVERRQKTLPVDNLEPNPWGLYQVHGNVFEWLEDCWNENYQGAPTDGSPWLTGDCARRVVRGRSWNDDPEYLRAASRYKSPTENRDTGLGFRVARSIDP